MAISGAIKLQFRIFSSTLLCGRVKLKALQRNYRHRARRGLFCNAGLMVAYP
jgi:hypothetical protein